MIKSFKDKETEKVFNQEFSKKLPVNIQRKALFQLIAINNARSLFQLVQPPSNHLEALTGKRLGEWSIRINRQWRITFIPINGGTDYIDVKIEDYH